MFVCLSHIIVIPFDHIADYYLLTYLLTNSLTAEPKSSKLLIARKVYFDALSFS